MVDQGEDPVTAAKREFVEEVLGLEYADLWRDSPLNEDMTEVFSNEKIVDRCYGECVNLHMIIKLKLGM